VGGSLRPVAFRRSPVRAAADRRTGRRPRHGLVSGGRAAGVSRRCRGRGWTASATAPASGRGGRRGRCRGGRADAHLPPPAAEQGEQGGTPGGRVERVGRRRGEQAAGRRAGGEGERLDAGELDGVEPLEGGQHRLALGHRGRGVGRVAAHLPALVGPAGAVGGVHAPRVVRAVGRPLAGGGEGQVHAAVSGEARGRRAGPAARPAWERAKAMRASDRADTASP